MKHLKKIKWLPDALSDGTIVTADGPYTLPPEEAIQYADYRFNKQQSMMPYNTVIALDRGEDCADKSDGNTTFTKTFLSKIGTAPVLIKSVLLPPNTITGDTEFDKTYPFYCLAVTIVSSEMDLTNTYLCLEACNTGHTHQPHAWLYQHTSFHALPFAAQKYLRGDVVKYKTLPDSQSFSFTIDKGETKLSLEGITQIENPKVGKTYYLYIALPYKYLRYKKYICNKAQITDEDYNTYIKFRPCIKYKRENTNDVNMYTLPLSSPYELNCKFPQIFYSAWSTNTTTLPAPVISVYETYYTSSYTGKIVTFGYNIEYPREDDQISFSSSDDWVLYSHDPINRQITLNITASTIAETRTASFNLHYPGAFSRQINIIQYGIPVINLESNIVSANSLGGIYNISLNITNPLDNVTISTSESYDWITAGGDNSNITITVIANTTTSSRTAYIYVRYTGARQKIITVSQEARPVITTNRTQIQFIASSSGLSSFITYTITNPIDGESISCSQSAVTWFNFTPDTTNKQISVTVRSTNTSTLARTGYIYLDYPNADRVTVIVSQNGTGGTISTTTTLAPIIPTYYDYTISAVLIGPPASTSTTISGYDESNGLTGISTALGGASLSITSTIRFTQPVTGYLRITAQALYNGYKWTGSTSIYNPSINAIIPVEITLTKGSMVVAADNNEPEPASLPEDSNSLEDILLDYETDQI